MSADPTLVPIDNPQQWQASLRLEFALRREATRLMRSSHNGPLYVQKPFYPEGPELAHVYLLHPPGGLVSGDELRIDVHTGVDSACLLTTPGAARIYKARSTFPRQLQKVHLRVARGASMEWFPLETIAYSGADVSLETSIELADGAHLGAWEITCLGRPANGETFQRGSFLQRYSVTVGGRPVFVDRFALGDHNRELLESPVGLQRQPVYGFLLMGPFAPSVDVLENLRRLAEPTVLSGRATITRLGDFYLGRYLGGSAEKARKLFTQWWQLLRPPLLGREACPPRIWRT